MAPPKETSEDFKFVMTCIKHSEVKIKPNFDEVAKEMGAKSSTACYHRLWAIQRKWGLTGTTKKGAGGSSTPSTPSRGRKRKEKVEQSEDETPTKKNRNAAVSEEEDDADVKDDDEDNDN